MSFVAIQQLQLDQGFAPVSDKRSLREIQEEQQARRVEDDFLKWWAAEEERVKQEGQSHSCAQREQAHTSRKSKQKISANQANAGPGPSQTPVRFHANASKTGRPKIKTAS